MLQVLMGAAFGALAAHTAAALGVYLIAPTAWAAVSEGLLKDASPWFDVFTAYHRLSSDQPFNHAAQSLTAIALWVGLPCLLGILRALRREVK